MCWRSVRVTQRWLWRHTGPGTERQLEMAAQGLAGGRSLRTGADDTGNLLMLLVRSYKHSHVFLVPHICFKLPWFKKEKKNVGPVAC